MCACVPASFNQTNYNILPTSHSPTPSLFCTPFPKCPLKLIHPSIHTFHYPNQSHDKTKHVPHPMLASILSTPVHSPRDSVCVCVRLDSYYILPLPLSAPFTLTSIKLLLLSWQSERLLTVRSMVRSHARASFCHTQQTNE